MISVHHRAYRLTNRQCTPKATVEIRLEQSQRNPVWVKVSVAGIPLLKERKTSNSASGPSSAPRSRSSHNDDLTILPVGRINTAGMPTANQPATETIATG